MIFDTFVSAYFLLESEYIGFENTPSAYDHFKEWLLVSRLFDGMQEGY